MELGVILREAVREDLTGRRTFEQRSERSDRLSHTGSWEGKLLGGISTRPRFGGSNQRCRASAAATERPGDRCVGGTTAAGALLRPHCLQSSHPAALYPRPLVLSCQHPHAKANIKHLNRLLKPRKYLHIAPTS